MMFERLRTLNEVIRSWGGSLLIVDELPKKDKDFGSAPFAWNDLGVNYPKKTIYLAFKAIALENVVGGIIHEAGHIFATKTPPDELVDESFFMGWEFVLARKVDLLDEWFRSMRDYMISGRDFGYENIDEQTDIIEEYVGRSRERGLIRGEEPIAVR